MSELAEYAQNRVVILTGTGMRSARTCPGSLGRDATISPGEKIYLEGKRLLDNLGYGLVLEGRAAIAMSDPATREWTGREHRQA